jgi:3-deoxy-7-phosphoheptulonate synthase
VILCERGIRTFEPATRNTLDLNAVPYVKNKTHLPIVVDPSHGTGARDLVPADEPGRGGGGADGLMIEVHRDPAAACRTARSRSTRRSSSADGGASGGRGGGRAQL